jgi:hypothetical protein
MNKYECSLKISSPIIPLSESPKSTTNLRNSMAAQIERQPLLKTVLLGKTSASAITLYRLYLIRWLGGKTEPRGIEATQAYGCFSPRNLHCNELPSLHGNLFSVAHYAIINSTKTIQTSFPKYLAFINKLPSLVADFPLNSEYSHPNYYTTL